MKIEISALRQSATLKVAIIGLLVIVLLIPIAMIGGVVNDRNEVAESARFDISRSWGGSQLVTGPLIHLLYTEEKRKSDGTTLKSDHSIFLLAETLQFESSIDTQLRRRGIYEVPVYDATVKMVGQFDLHRIRDFVIPENEIHWDSAVLLFGMSDASTVASKPTLKSGDFEDDFDSTAVSLPRLPPLLGVSIGDVLIDRIDATKFEFAIEFIISGSELLEFLPLADDSKVMATSNWHSPSFVGRRLPGAHEISDEGFEATWNTTSLGRSLPTIWGDGRYVFEHAADGAFGVRLVQPVGLYQLMHRAMNYAVLFIGLTFITYFMMEIISGARLHPLQYLMVGFANALFYLLLLSFAEHFGFGPAYIASALSCSVLIVGYSRSVLPHRRQAVAMACVLLALYLYLYMTLQAEKYALVAGSIGLWVVLGTVMYLTRRIDWYAMRGGTAD